MKIVVSNNSFVYDELGGPGFRLVHADPTVCASGEEALAAARDVVPDLVVLDGDLPGELDGYGVCERIKADERLRTVRVIIVVQGSVSSKQLQRLAECGCDDVVMYKLPGETLYNHAARLLGLPDPSLGAPVQLEVAIARKPQHVTAHATRLSTTDVALITDAKLERGASLTLVLRRSESSPPLEVRGRVLESERDVHSGQPIATVVFEDITTRQRVRLADMALWDARQLPAGLRVSIRGSFDENTDFTGVQVDAADNVIFDVSGVRWINSWGARKWIMFLRSLPDELTYSFVNASPVFIKHCNMVQDMLGTGSVLSFAAPYECRGCGRENDRILQVSSITPAIVHEPPEFRCPLCGGVEAFEDVSERYFAFLELPGR